MHLPSQDSHRGKVGGGGDGGRGKAPSPQLPPHTPPESTIHVKAGGMEN